MTSDSTVNGRLKTEKKKKKKTSVTIQIISVAHHSFRTVFLMLVVNQEKIE